MVSEFNGFTQGVIGKKLPADTTLNNMKKSELIELLHLAQHNYDTLKQFYTNSVNVNAKELNKSSKEIRDKALDEFSEKFIYKAVCSGCSGCTGCYEEERQCECEEWKSYMEIAEQTKEARG